jgi:formate dehydrogenase major subunit
VPSIAAPGEESLPREPGAQQSRPTEPLTSECLLSEPSGSVAPHGAKKEDRQIKIGKVRSHATGWQAVVMSLRRTVSAAGPVDALKALAHINQVRGFDCPSCAWPETENRKRAEFCESGANAVAEETARERADADFFAAHSLVELEAADDFWLGRQGRLVEPMIRRPGSTHFEAISFDEAYDEIASALGGLDDPNEAVFYTSGRTSNEAAYCYQLFARAFGTNNLPDCSNMCHEPTSVTMTATIGVGKSTVTFDDFSKTDLVILLGQNPGTTAPRMLTTLEEAKARGAKIVAVNPMPEAGLLRFKNPQTLKGLLGPGTAIADLYCPVALNGDLALMQVINRFILDRGDLDTEFIGAHTEGFEEVASHLRALDLNHLRTMTGLTDEVIDNLLAMISSTNRIIVCWAMGITQHRNAGATIGEIVNFGLLKGLVGRPGAGLSPIRGHSNVQGDRTMGVWEKPQPAFMAKLHEEFAFVPPTGKGHDVVSAIDALETGQVRFVMSLGGNLARACPDSNRTEAALRSCDLGVHVATKLNRSHLITGRSAIIFPTLGRTDIDMQAGTVQKVTVEDTFGFVKLSQGVLRPPSETMHSEVEIVCNMAQRVVPDVGKVPWQQFSKDYNIIRDSIARTVVGFENFNDRVNSGVGFTLVHLPRDRREFPTDTGRAKFTVNETVRAEAPSDGVLLQTLRSHEQFNTTIYGFNDRYRGVSGGRLVLFVNSVDITRLGLNDGQLIDIVSIDSKRRARGFRVVDYPVAVGSVAGYFPELNAVVGLDDFDATSRTPAYKSVAVRLVNHMPNT